MKKSIQLVILTGFWSFGILAGCTDDPSIEMAQTPNQEVKSLGVAIDLTDMNYREDQAQYKEVTTWKIFAYQKRIADLYNMSTHENEGIRIAQTKKIMELESKISDAKRKLTEYNAGDKEQWKTFKQGFEAEMHTIGSALNELSTHLLKL